MSIDLPISKSIANRLLILQQLHGDELMPVSAAMPEDVQQLYHILHACPMEGQIDLGNNGTAMRFLTAYFAQLPGSKILLTGCQRMKERPIHQLVTALRELGASIRYLGQEGFPPLFIEGKVLTPRKLRLTQPISSQFVSALLLIGIEVETDSLSPYITMTRAMIRRYPKIELEYDWSAAAFWYEYVALHPCTLHLKGLHNHSLQGDQVVAELFAQFGVITTYQTKGISISSLQPFGAFPKHIELDFSLCPDLYPAFALTCERLGISLQATGVHSLRYKESDRLWAVDHHQVMADHRIAMALLAADYDIVDIQCIRKSYPQFYQQLCALKRSFLEKE